MDNKNQILELRQNGNNSIVYSDPITGKVRNGDFKARLRERIVLNQGDTLRLNQVFLQTDEVEEDVIVIEKTLTLRMDFIRYLKDVDNVSRPIPNDRTYTGTSGSTTNPLTMSIPLDKTPSFLVNQNTFNAYGGGSFNNDASHGVYQRKGEIYTEAKSITQATMNAEANKHKVFEKLSFLRKDLGKPSSRFNVILEVVNTKGTNVRIVITVPPMTTASEQTVTVNFMIKTDTSFTNGKFRIVNELLMNEANIIVGVDVLTAPNFLNNLAHFVPTIQQKTITLNAGNYHATELGQIITNAFTDSNLSSGQTISSSSALIREPSLLGLAEQDLNEIPTFDGNNLPHQDIFRVLDDIKVFVNASNSARFNWYGTIGAMQRNPSQPAQTPIKFLKNSPPIVCGSDSFALEYDNELNKFKITRMHTSIRDETNNNPSVQVLDNPTTGNGSAYPPPFLTGHPSTYINSPQHSYLATSYGGIILTCLSATEIGTNNFVDFWEGTLGFDLSVITQKPVQDGTAIATKTGNTFTPVISGSDTIIFYESIPENIVTYSYGGLKANDNITEDVSSIDGLHNLSTVSGTATTRGHTYYNLIDIQNFDTTNKLRLAQFVNTTLTSQIFASRTLQTSNISFAYYLIDINARIENDYISEDDRKKNIFSVINRYYIQGGYLSGTNSGIQYTHEGESMMISDFDVRILKPTGQIADNLKADNTVFLEVIRG